MINQIPGVSQPVAPSERARDVKFDPAAPFAGFLADIQNHQGLRATIDASYRIPETECLPGLLEAATLPTATKQKAHALAGLLVAGLRARPGWFRV
jgi:RHH-type transcriptional regulator, proline utilization regulon repressor / proline dehydrogenase / delta 1-pyrroline-5-carboxylate dehydrogenase